ncbi:MAG TPA: metal ABC transporter permease [Ignavibacteriaceae bacterium]|nr:metal ABC transporter permease [Ignavibacteriaceae bacterium]
METINQLIQLFPYAVLGSILAGMICGFLGTFVVSQRVVFLGATLTQVAVAGVAFSFLHAINLEGILTSLLGIKDHSIAHNFEPVFYSLLFAVIVVLIFSQTYKQKILTQDGILGIIFVVAVALRIMFIQKSPIAEVSEVESILKGDILFIGQSQFYTLLGIFIFTLGMFTVFQKQLKFVTFDAESASAHGINSRFWLLIFYIVVGMGISLTTRFVGDVFTFAYLIIPSSIGILLSKKVWQVFLIAVVVGAIIPPISIFLAFKYDFSSGPAAVVTAFILFLLVYLYRKIRGN